MKKKILTLIPVLFIGLNCFTCSAQYKESKQTNVAERNQKIYEITKKDLNSFLENIPEGFEKQHGFNNRSEFKKATPGPVYTIIGVGQDGKSAPANLYNVPVVVEGTYRAMITVSCINGVYAIETVGAALLATELQQLENEKKPAPDAEKIMLNVYSKSSGFVGYQETNSTIEQVNFIPLTSAKTALNNAPRIIKPGYKLAEVIDLLISEK